MIKAALTSIVFLLGLSVVFAQTKKSDFDNYPVQETRYVDTKGTNFAVGVNECYRDPKELTVWCKFYMKSIDESSIEKLFEPKRFTVRLKDNSEYKASLILVSGPGDPFSEPETRKIERFLFGTGLDIEFKVPSNFTEIRDVEFDSDGTDGAIFKDINIKIQ